METIKIPALKRELAVESFALRKEKDENTYRLSFSAASDYPVERYFGTEVLDFGKGAVRLDRASRGAMPLLFNHNMDAPLGMVDKASIENGRMLVDAHLFDTPAANDVRAMIDGGLRNVSIGYRLHEVTEATTGKDAGTQRITDWEPYEVSIVTVPADPTVGIGRDIDGQNEFDVRIVRAAKNPAETAKTQGAKAMSDQDKSAPPAGDAVRVEEMVDRPPAPDAVQIERDHRRAITNLCSANKISDQVREMWIDQGLSFPQISEDLVKILKERGESNPQSVAKVGMNSAETRKYSLLRAIEACASGKWDKAGLELDAHRAVQDRIQEAPDPHKFYVPYEVLQRQVGMQVPMRRDLTAASAGAGGYLVETQNVGFIDMLRNRSVCMRMGGTRLTGLVGSVTIPKQSAAGTAYWLTNEATQITEAQQTFVQIALTPKNVGAYTEISRQLLLQSSPAAEGIVTGDLAQVVAIAVDLAGLEGSGAGGQPTGISGTSGVGSVSGTSLAAAGIIEFQSDVATGNVMPTNFGYVTTPAVAGLLMVRPELPSTGTTRLWTGNLWDGQLFSFPAMTTNQLTAATMIAGDWSKLIIAEWGTLAVEVNPYADFKAGIIGVRAMYSIDVGVRIPVAFSRATTIT